MLVLDYYDVKCHNDIVQEYFLYSYYNSFL